MTSLLTFAGSSITICLWPGLRSTRTARSSKSTSAGPPGRDDDVAEVAVLVQRGRYVGEPGVGVGEDVLAAGREAADGQAGETGVVPVEVGGVELAGVGGAVQPPEDRSDVFQV